MPTGVAIQQHSLRTNETIVAPGRKLSVSPSGRAPGAILLSVLTKTMGETGMAAADGTLHTEQAPLGYEVRVVVLLGLAFGFAYFDRMAMTFLSPYVVKDLGLTNTQVGALGSGLSVTWALGAYFIGRWSDSVGKRKPFLLAFMVIFSFCSVLSGLAAGFGTLFASRMVMGAVEGPFLPICLAIIAAASMESRRGLNVGIVQNFFGSLIGTALAPIILVAIADAWGWRYAFYLAGVPGLVLAVLIWLLIHEPPLEPRGADHRPP